LVSELILPGQIKMPLQITSEDDYILVEFTTQVNFWRLMEGIAEVFSMPEFKSKNDIWVFRKGQMEFSFTDLNKIKDLAGKFYPVNSNGTKTAIVTETGIQQSLAKMYSEIGKDLPREIRVFSVLKSAKEWITK
jgi:hypothetical protein